MNRMCRTSAFHARSMLWGAFACLALAPGGCDRSPLAGSAEGSTRTVREADAQAALPAGVVSTGPIPEAPGLTEVLKGARVGDRVAFAARIAGRAEPFVPRRAMMVVADAALVPIKGDEEGCETNPELCCATREALLAGTATVQIVDERGRAIAVGLAGVEGLKVFDHVFVEGILVERGDEGGFVVNATRLVKRSPA